MRLAQKSLSVIALGVSLSALSAFGQSEGMPWRADLQTAQAEAQKTGKLVLAHFWTESCGPCRALESRVFSQPSVAMGVSDKYVPVKINANEHPELARRFGVTRVPTDAVVTPQGELVKAFVSPATPMDYVGYVTRLAGAYRAQVGGGFAAASANAPDGSGYQGRTTNTVAPDAAFNQAYADLVGQNAAPPVAPAAVQAKTVASNPYAAEAAKPQAAAAPAPVVNNVYADVTPEVPAPVAPAASTVAKDGPQLPPGTPPLGFDGFCPVTMKSDWRWAKGDVRFGAIHRGRTYLFASSESQKAFLADPDTYSPVLAGSDPVAAVDERRNVPGEREFAVEYEGRFYLFSNETTLEKFWTDPTSYAKGVERVAALPAGESFIR